MSEKRILIIGSDQHPASCTSFTWDNLPGKIQLADYEIVIFNLAVAEDAENAVEIQYPNPLDVDDVLRHLFGGRGEILIVGNPKVDIIEKLKPGVQGTRFFSLYRWLPLLPKISSAEGETIEIVDDSFLSYFQHVKNWCFYTENKYWEQNRYRDYTFLHPQAQALTATQNDIAQTRFGHAIAFSMTYSLHEKVRSLGGRTALGSRILNSTKLSWLPTPTQISSTEGINILLQERFDVELSNALPPWISNYKLPEQIPLEEEISAHKKTIAQLQKRISTLSTNLSQAIRLRGILYEQGEYSLEPLVRDALKELGADVQEPSRKGHEDGRLTDPFGRNFMIEIKGRSGTLRLSDVREANQWVQDALIEEEYESKGLLIANLKLTEPPSERKQVFPSNCVGRAERVGICLLTTTQIFAALQSYQNGNLNLKEFWDTLYQTNGVCALPEPQITLDNE